MSDTSGHEFILLGIPDVNGSIRGKALRPAAFESALRQGTVMTDLILGLDPVDTPITDYRSSLAADRARYIRFTTALLDHGVRALERGAWFLSSAHTDELIDETIAAVETVAKTI